MSEVVHIDFKDGVDVEIGEFAFVAGKEGALEECLDADKDDALEGGREQLVGDVARGVDDVDREVDGEKHDVARGVADEQRETCSVKIDFSRQMFGKRDDILDNGNVEISWSSQDQSN